MRACRPSALLFTIGAAIVTACVSLVLLRPIGKTEQPSVIWFYFTVLPLPFLDLAMLCSARCMTWRHGEYCWRWVFWVELLNC